jgi:DNA-binding Lrp family transcriptional regulator
MEKLGVIKGYKAILNAKTLGIGATAFIFASFSYGDPEAATPLSQRDLAQQISQFSEVQEVHIVTGDWDILIKVKAKDVDAVGEFVIDRLRLVKGIKKTLTCMVFDTEKESTDISLTRLAKSR